MLSVVVRSLALLCLLYPTFAQAQVGIGTTTPNPYAVLHLHHGTVPRGFLLPRMSTAERNTLGTNLGPTDIGMMVADTNTVNGGIFVWGGSGWDRMFPVANSPWEESGGNVFLTNLGNNVGIGTASPTHLLDVTASQVHPLVRIYNTNAASGASVLHLRTNANDLSTDLLRATSSIGDVMKVQADGSIGMGVAPLAGAQVFIRSNRFRTLRVENNGTATATDAIFGENNNNAGTSSAVRGHATAPTGVTYGVYGYSNSTDINSAGIYGTGQGGSAIRGELSTATAGSAVMGQYLGTGAGRGVYGRTNSNANQSTGVYGEATNAATNATFGVFGTTNSSNSLGAGVYGTATAGANGVMAVNNIQSSAFALRVDREVLNSTSNITAARIWNSSTSTTASLNKIGLVIDNTGAWTGATARNIGLQVNVSGGTQNIAALFTGGNVGIGTSNPTTRLHVDGDFRYVNGTQAAGFVLTSDANGNANWSPPATYTASNGLNMVGNDVRLGGTIDHPTNIDITNETITFDATYSGNPIILKMVNREGHLHAYGMRMQAGTEAEISAGGGLNTGDDGNPITLMAGGGNDTGNGGEALLQGGDGGSSGGNGGDVTIRSGFEWAGSGGRSGNINISPAYSASGNYGNIHLAWDFSNSVPAGNVGIGTNNPTARLHLDGNFRYVNGSQAAGYVLTSDANGNANWAPPATGGTASNGLNMVVNDVRIGGTLSQSTVVDVQSFNLELFASSTGNGISVVGDVGYTRMQKDGLYGYGDAQTNVYAAHSYNNSFAGYDLDMRAGNGYEITNGGILRLHGGRGGSVLGRGGDAYLYGGDEIGGGGDNSGSVYIRPGQSVSTKPGDVILAWDEILDKRMGNVGIGTGTPNQALHIRSGFIRMEQGAAAGYVLTSDIDGVGTWVKPIVAAGIGTNQTLRWDGSTWVPNSMLQVGNFPKGVGINAAPTNNNYLIVDDTKIGDNPAVFFRSVEPQFAGGVNNPLRLQVGNAPTSVGLDVIGSAASGQTVTGVAVSVSGGGTRYAATFDGGRVGVGTTTPTSTLQVNGSTAVAVLTANNAFTFNETHNVIIHTATTNQIFNLPAANTCPGRIYTIKKTTTSNTSLSLAPNGADTIEGVNGNYNPGISTARVSYSIVSDGASGWWVIHKSNN
jgi:hypothetical protein